MSQTNELPIELKLFREAPLPEESTLSHLDRVTRLQKYRTIRMDYATELTKEELRHVAIMLGANRAETLRQKRADTAGAKKASATPVKVLTLDDL
jgi:hypothetical protein